MAHGKEQPFELIEWEMAERFKWTLEYIQNLPVGKLHEYLQIVDGKAKAAEQLAKKNRKK